MTMPSFRSPSSQAARAVARASAIGKARHGSRSDGKIHSLGSARNHLGVLRTAADWDHANGALGIQNWDRERALAYLSERAEVVGQKTLDMDRQALQILPRVGRLERVRSEVGRGGLAEQSRAYTDVQVREVIGRQSGRHALASEIADKCGLRAHELLTLRRGDERPASSHREWSPARFTGRSGVLYTVVGKGGLVREVMVPADLAERLEARRLDEPREVRDRGINYEQHYNIGAGQAWSQSWASASRSAFGWSRGAHGLRHGYAQQRMDELQRSGMTYQRALGVVSQELGHYRVSITEVYLR